jgi:hypothetical protein
MLPANIRATRLAKAHNRTVYVHLNSEGRTALDSVTFEFSEEATKAPIIRAEPDGTWQYIGWMGNKPENISKQWDIPREMFERNVGQNEAMGGKHINFNVA